MNFFRTWAARFGGKEDLQMPCDVAVVIPCHNYAHLLAGAIESVLAQTKTPRDILVVDDASDDHPEHVVFPYVQRGVRYMRVNHRSLSKTRNSGAAGTDSEFLLYLDPDDRLPANYIERCLKVLDDRRIGFAYGDQVHTGESNRRIKAPQYDEAGLMRSNFVSSNALIRRQAFDLIGGYRDKEHALEDWDFLRRLIQAGYRGAKAETSFLYAIHDDSLVHDHNRDAKRSYCRDAALEAMPITIFTPFAGRREVLARYKDALKKLDFDPALVRLHWYNTSPDDAFDALLRSEMSDLPFGELRYTRAPLPDAWNHSPDSLIKKRIKDVDDAEYYYQMAVVRAYNHMIRSCSTEYVLTLEDDMALRPDTVKRLIAALDWNVAAVIAPYKSGFFPRYEAWTANADGTVSNFKQKGKGIEEVGGCGFGCTLFRMTDLRNIAPIFTGVKSRPRQWYDQLSYLRLAQWGKVLCDWDGEVEHMKTERHAEGLATSFT